MADQALVFGCIELREESVDDSQRLIANLFDSHELMNTANFSKSVKGYYKDTMSFSVSLKNSATLCNEVCVQIERIIQALPASSCELVFRTESGLKSRLISYSFFGNIEGEDKEEWSKVVEDMKGCVLEDKLVEL